MQPEFRKKRDVADPSDEDMALARAARGVGGRGQQLAKYLCLGHRHVEPSALRAVCLS